MVRAIQNRRIILYQTTTAYSSAILDDENLISKEERSALLAKISEAESHLRAVQAEYYPARAWSSPQADESK